VLITLYRGGSARIGAQSRALMHLIVMYIIITYTQAKQGRGGAM